MAFQGAPALVVDTPLGIPHAMAPPADVAQCIQLIHSQVQAQQAAQQAQQQQMAAMLNHLVITQNAGLPSVGGTGNGATKGPDERHFRRIQKFDNKTESWKKW